MLQKIKTGEIFCSVCQDSKCKELANFTSDLDGEHYHVMKCRNCGLLFLHPLPELTPQKLEGIYGEAYAESVFPVEETKILKESINRQMEVVENYVKRGKALNVGAMGSEVNEIKKRGWSLSIVDASRYAVERTLKNGEADEVILSKIEDLSYPAESFDFIRFTHVIEHLSDPSIVLEKLCSLLKKGGVLQVETDNAEGLETRLEAALMGPMRLKSVRSVAERLVGKKYNLRYGRLTPPVHLYTFTFKSLILLLESKGFKVLKTINPSWGDPTWFPIYKRSLLEMIFVRIDQLGGKFGRGNVITILAQKA